MYKKQHYIYIKVLQSEAIYAEIVETDTLKNISQEYPTYDVLLEVL